MIGKSGSPASSFPMMGLPSLEKGMMPAHVLSISRLRRSGKTSEACSLFAVTFSERAWV